jgi:hypothetical protein
MINDRHFGVVHIDHFVFDMAMKRPEVPPEFREEYLDRRRVGFLSDEGRAFMECLMHKVAEDIKALGPDFDFNKHEIEISATLQPKGTNKFIKVD